MKKDKSRNKSKKVNTDVRYKAPTVSRTKGYYPFSGDFPGVTDENGMRDNRFEGTREERKHRERKTVISVFAVVFVLTFLISFICLNISNYPVSEPSSAEEDVIRINRNKTVSVFIPVQKLYTISLERYIDDLKTFGVNGVVIEVKSPNGYLGFEPDDFSDITSGAIEYVFGDFASAVRTFNENGMEVSALFSCFADTFAASYLSDMSVWTVSDGENPSVLWYDDSDNGRAWLDPFSSKSSEYLGRLLSYVADSGVREIILSGVQLPDCGNFDEADFSEHSTDEVNVKMAEFVSGMKEKFAGKCGISCMTTLGSVLDSSSVNHLTDVEDGKIYIDMRLSVQKDNMTIDGNTFTKPSEKPYMFISNAVYAAGNVIGRSKGNAAIIPVIEASSTSAQQVTALKAHEIYSYCIYDSQASYTENEIR